MTLLRRYAPFAVLVAAQMVFVLVAPSNGAPSRNQLGGTFQGAGNSGPSSSGPSASGPTAAGPTAPLVTGPGAAPVGASTAPSTSATSPSLLASGGTKPGLHCLPGLLDHFPCVPEWAGGSNGGATWQGVTAKSVTVVMYRAKDNAAVDAILQETGTYTSPQTEQTMLRVVTDWMNKHFQLYGRTINFVYTQGNCDIAPPDDTCFRTDADGLVASYHPFAVMWDSDTNEPAFFDELARKGVVSWGGWAFADGFNNNLRPYHYDLFMGGDTQAEIAGTWYCRRLANHAAEYAGDANLKVLPRKTAVVYADTPQTTPAAKHLEAIIKSCDKNGVVDAPYSSNTATATQQAATDTSTYKNEGVTTLMWFSDLIAPAYGTKAEAAQNWHPEEVIAGEGLLDYDALAQTYESTEWAHAFGPSDLAGSTTIDVTDAGRIWKMEGQSGSANQNSNLLTSYALSLVGGIQAAGPKLTPLTYEYGVLTCPGFNSWAQWHDPRLTYIKYGKDDYTGISDIREVYYDPNKTSPDNGRAGAYVPLNSGRRYQLSDLPSGEPSLPSSV